MFYILFCWKNVIEIDQSSVISCILVQVNGNWRCLGSPAYLRTKYGGGYEISVEFVLETGRKSSRVGHLLEQLQEQLLEDVQKLGFDFDVIDSRGTFLLLRFPKVSEPLEVAALLDFFADRDDLNFLVGQMHLEHVFNRFAAAYE